jgi:hypothetical protein
VTDLDENVADSAPIPQTIRTAAALVSLESLALVGGAVVLLIMAATRTTTRLWAALAIVGFAIVGAVILGLCARGLSHLRPSARSPVMLAQFLALPVGYSLGFQAHRMVIAAPLLIVAVAVLALLFAPSARQALDRVL